MVSHYGWSKIGQTLTKMVRSQFCCYHLFLLSLVGFHLLLPRGISAPHLVSLGIDSAKCNGITLTRTRFQGDEQRQGRRRVLGEGRRKGEDMAKQNK